MSVVIENFVYWSFSSQFYFSRCAKTFLVVLEYSKNDVLCNKYFLERFISSVNGSKLISPRYVCKMTHQKARWWSHQSNISILDSIRLPRLIFLSSCQTSKIDWEESLYWIWSCFDSITSSWTIVRCLNNHVCNSEWIEYRCRRY